MKLAVIHTAFEETPRTVAFVDVPVDTVAAGVDACLEYAFRWTQNIADSWSMKGERDGNDNVTVMADLPVSKKTGQVMGLRSTSVGDQILFGNKKYRVAFAGFEEVT
jgi:hypothetical protein